MVLSTFHVRDHLVIRLVDVVDIANVDLIGAELRRAVREFSGAAVIIDVRGACLTSAGIRLFEETQSYAEQCGLRLRLTTSSPLMRRVLRYAQAQHLLLPGEDVPCRRER